MEKQIEDSLNVSDYEYIPVRPESSIPEEAQEELQKLEQDIVDTAEYEKEHHPTPEDTNTQRFEDVATSKQMEKVINKLDKEQKEQAEIEAKSDKEFKKNLSRLSNTEHKDVENYIRSEWEVSDEPNYEKWLLKNPDYYKIVLESPKMGTEYFGIARDQKKRIDLSKLE